MGEITDLDSMDKDYLSALKRKYGTSDIEEVSKESLASPKGRMSRRSRREIED
jgi:hypothetical protein